MRMEIRMRKRGAEPPMLVLDVSEEETGLWVLSAAYCFTDDYTSAIKAFTDGDGHMADRVPFHAWENVHNDVLRIISEEVDEEIKAKEEIGTFTDLVFRIDVNDKSLAHLAEKIAATVKQKYPDLFQ